MFKTLRLRKNSKKVSNNVIGVFKFENKKKSNIDVKDREIGEIIDSNASLPQIPDIIEDFKKETSDEFDQILHKYL
nr:10967_t:CDS:2 [Entrophospora candida]CAG8496005.1 5968_t:CDS:2 [Entrophospora candida]